MFYPKAALNYVSLNSMRTNVCLIPEQATGSESTFFYHHTPSYPLLENAGLLTTGTLCWQDHPARDKMACHVLHR